MENEYEEYGENPVGGMMTDYDYHLNTGELPELLMKNQLTISSPTSMTGIEIKRH